MLRRFRISKIVVHRSTHWMLLVYHRLERFDPPAVGSLCQRLIHAPLHPDAVIERSIHTVKIGAALPVRSAIELHAELQPAIPEQLPRQPKEPVMLPLLLRQRPALIQRPPRSLHSLLTRPSTPQLGQCC